MKMNNKKENILITGYNGGPVTAKYDDPKTEERLHENCVINIYDICSHN